MNKFMKAINEYFKDAPAIHVDTIFDGGDKYLFKIKNDLYKGAVDTLDPWYTIDKKSAVVKGFQPPENMKWFNNTLQNEVKSFI